MAEQLDSITRDFLSLIEKVSSDELKSLPMSKMLNAYLDDLEWLINKYHSADTLQILKKIVEKFPGFRFLEQTYDTMFDITIDANKPERFLLFVFEYRFSRQRKFDFTVGYQFGRFTKHVMKDYLENDQACVVSVCNKFGTLHREKIVSCIKRCGYEVSLNPTTYEITSVQVVKYISIKAEHEKNIIADFNNAAIKFLEQHAENVIDKHATDMARSEPNETPEVLKEKSIEPCELDFKALYPTVPLYVIPQTKTLLQTDQIDLFETSLESVTTHAKQSIAKMREQHENILILKDHVSKLEEKNKEIQAKLDKYQDIVNKISTELTTNQ